MVGVPLVFVLAAAIVAAAPLVILARRIRRVRRANRVVPTRASAAPLWWLWVPGPSARLHRRLVSATAAARFGVAACGSEPIAPLSRALAELEAVAAHLDDGVVAASRLPRGARWRALHELVPEIRAVEDAAQHAVVTAARFTSTGRGAPGQRLAGIHDELAALDAAVEEVRQIDVTRSA